ncbi:MAG: alcohol dehydrogenase [Thermoproteota archaeon]|nr:alcohol dehydrogenase [Thermoproteota archaeon]
MVMSESLEAQKILRKWKGSSYVFGERVLNKVGELTKLFGKRTLLVISASPWVEEPRKIIERSLEKSGISYTIVNGARANAPREDVYRITFQVTMYRPDSIIAVGGGSTIDACKAASVLATYSSSDVSRVLNVKWDVAGTIDPYFGTGLVTKVRDATKKDLITIIAVQTGASSGAHLTKYSNITDLVTKQKKLIVDDALVPKAAIFDYSLTIGTPKNLTIDGGFDGVAHVWEVFAGAVGKSYYEEVKRIAKLGISLIVKNLKFAVENPGDIKARTALGLGTDLGGYAIMIGGTSGPHLGSFSLVDVLTHGRACWILNPYYTVFFSTSIQDQLRTMAPIFKEAGFIKEGDLEGLEGRILGETVAEGMIGFTKSLGAPTTLREAGATDEHLIRMLSAARDPQLKMKLMNMPVPMDPDKGDLEMYMKPLLEAAFTGNLKLVKAYKP